MDDGEGDVLSADDYRRLLTILEAAGPAESTADFRRVILEALEDQLGYAGSAFFLAGPPAPGFKATDGVLHGYAQKGLEEYATYWADREPFGRPEALTKLRREGAVDFEGIFDRHDSGHRDYVDDWLRPQAISGYLLLWIDTGLPLHGYLSLLDRNGRTFDRADRLRLLALRPHLGHMLRSRLQRGAAPPTGGVALSARETAVARMVASGWRNREIAAQLQVSEDTVKKHVYHAFQKLGVRSRTQLAVKLR